jgi:hypothetical protein
MHQYVRCLCSFPILKYPPFHREGREVYTPFVYFYLYAWSYILASSDFIYSRVGWGIRDLNFLVSKVCNRSPKRKREGGFTSAHVTTNCLKKLNRLKKVWEPSPPVPTGLICYSEVRWKIKINLPPPLSLLNCFLRAWNFTVLSGKASKKYFGIR